MHLKPHPTFSLPSPARRLATGLFALLAALAAQVEAATWYVATNGADTNPGTLAAPFATIMRAQTAAASGDTVFVRGGTYSTFSIAFTDSNYNYVHRLNKNGIHWSAFPGETPVFNFASIPTNLRVCGFHVTGSAIRVTGFHVTGTPVGNQKQSECWRIDGSAAQVDFVDCAAYDNAANGFYWTNRSRGSATRCDAYNNIGTSGESIGNTDGFGAHGSGVVFRYCRSWNNSDDAYDCISSIGANTFDHCWAFNTRAGGDNSGFKIGGFGADPATVPPSPLPTHTVTYCVSAFNRAHGFYANHHPGKAADWIKNTAYNNSGSNYNMLERTTNMSMDIPGVLEVLHFNIAYVGTTIINDNLPAANKTNNSWTIPGVAADASDFVSEDWTQLAAPRSAGNNMPFVTFMHLTPGSDLAGLGAFDPPPAAPTNVVAAWVNSSRVDLTWTASPAATEYYVRRAIDPAGPYTSLAVRLPGTSFTDNTVVAGTDYFYEVSAMNAISYDEGVAQVAAVMPPVAITAIDEDNGLFTADGITRDNTLFILGTAAPGSSVTVARIGTGNIGSTVANASGDWVFDYTGTVLPDGTHVFSATAIDPANGLPFTSDPFTVIVSTVAADAPVITGVHAVGAELVVVGTAAPHSLVTVTVDGTLELGTTSADAAGLWSFAFGDALALGVHEFTAVSVDLAGNLSPVSLVFSIDTSVPAPAIVAALSNVGPLGHGAYSPDPTLSLTGTAAPDVAVTVTRHGAGVAGVAVAGPDGAWALDYTGTVLPEGLNTFSATASSGEGQSAASPLFSINVDSVTPAVLSISRLEPAAATITSAVTEVVFRVTFSETVYGVAPSAFQLTGPVTGVISGVSATSGAVIDVTISSVDGTGSLRLDLKASSGVADLAGNSPAAFTSGQTYNRVLFVNGSGTWIRSETGGLWSTPANWLDAVIPSGTTHNANFGTIDVVDTHSVVLDSARTVNSLTFGDFDPESAGNWRIENNGVLTNALTLGGTVPTITVGELGTGANATIAARLSGSGGFTKAGPGTLVVAGANNIGGALVTAGGQMRVGGGNLSASTVAVNALGAQMHIDAGSFNATGTTTITGAANTAVVVNGGTATFNAVTFTTSSLGTFRVNGGTASLSSLTVPRSSDAVLSYTTGFIITGGSTTVGDISLGTANSNGAMSIEGGSVTSTGTITVGWQATAGRGGGIRVLDGTFTSTNTTNGLVLNRVPSGGNTNNVTFATFSGGVSTIERITFGFNSSVTAGSATVTVDGGALYLGSNGFVKNGTAGMTSTINLTSGILGAKANWATSHPAVFTTGGDIAIKAANAAGVPFNITLSGVLSGSGALTKTGGGLLTFNGNNTRTGVTTIREGVLSIGTIGNGGVSGNLGQASSAATNLVLDGGTLRFTGAGSTTNRLFSVGEGGGTIEVTGAGTLHFTSAGALGAPGAGDRTLTLASAGPSVHTLTPALTDPESGATSLVKTGAGTWTLAGDSTASGLVTVDAGTLNVTGSLAVGGALAINSGATLTGTGTVNKDIVLNSGATIAPAGPSIGTLSGASLTWHGGGTYRATLGGGSDTLALSGSLLAGASGERAIVFEGAAPATGMIYTLATYGSTDLTAADFSTPALPGVVKLLLVEPTSLRFVTAPEGPAAQYDLWTYLKGVPVDRRSFDDDPAGDGVANGLKFFLGIEPLVAHPEGIVAMTVSINGTIYPAVTFNRRQDPGGVSGIVLVARDPGFTTDLGSAEVSAESLGDGFERVVVRSLVPLSEAPDQFFRLIVSLPTE